MNVIASTLNKMLGLFLLAIFLFACGDDAPTPEGTVYVRYEGAITSLNPYLSGSSAYSRWAATKIFQELGITDPQTMELKPLLIKEIPKSRKVDSGPFSGSYAYDFEILEEANWDNGTPVTGRDYEFSLKLIQHPLLPTGVWRGYFEFYKGMEIDPANPKKFTIYLTQYYILGVESLCQMPVYPAYHYDPENALQKLTLADLMDTAKTQSIIADSVQIKFADNFKSPKYGNDPNFIVGSGAYRVENFDTEKGLTLVRKPEWWGDKVDKKNPLLGAYPERLVYRVVKPEEMVENMLRNGELDVALNMSVPKFLELKSDTSLQRRYNFETRLLDQVSRWMFNTRNPKLSDKRVRQALCQLVDYDYIIKNLYKGIAQRTVGLIPPQKPYYAKNIKPYELNPQEARKLLESAGWTDTDGNGVVDKVLNGKKTELAIDLMYDNSSTTGTGVANSMVESMKQGGVKINLVPIEITKISALTRQGEFESAILIAVHYPGLIDLSPYYKSTSIFPAGDNRSGLANPELDKVLDAIRETEDPAKRNVLYRQAQEIIYDESPEAFLNVPEQRYIVAKRFNYVISSNRPGFYEQLFKLK